MTFFNNCEMLFRILKLVKVITRLNTSNKKQVDGEKGLLHFLNFSVLNASLNLKFVAKLYYIYNILILNGLNQNRCFSKLASISTIIEIEICFVMPNLMLASLVEALASSRLMERSGSYAFLISLS